MMADRMANATPQMTAFHISRVLSLKPSIGVTGTRVVVEFPRRRSSTRRSLARTSSATSPARRYRWSYQKQPGPPDARPITGLLKTFETLDEALAGSSARGGAAKLDDGPPTPYRGADGRVVVPASAVGIGVQWPWLSREPALRRRERNL
jgi:hypothetical protein